MSALLLDVLTPTTLPLTHPLNYSGFKHLSMRANLVFAGSTSYALLISAKNAGGSTISVLGARRDTTNVNAASTTAIAGTYVEVNVPSSTLAYNSLALEAIILNYSDPDIKGFFHGETVSETDSYVLVTRSIAATYTSTDPIASLEFESTGVLATGSTIRIFGHRG